jgi:tetratricopeptide (TPR) repeat protein
VLWTAVAMPLLTRSIGCFALALALAGTSCVDPSTEHRVRANAFFRGGDFAAAEKECNEGLSARPDDVATLILRGKTLFELGRSEEAKRDFDRSVELGAGKGKTYVGDAYLGLAIIASRSKDWPLARDDFEKLLALDPNDIGTRANLARVYLELGDLAKAKQNAEIAANARPGDEANLFMLGKVELAANDLDGAAAAFGKIRESNARAASAPYGLAMVAARRGDRAAALASLREAIALKVPNPGEIAHDPAFASVAADPEFLQLAAGATGAGRP